MAPMTPRNVTHRIRLRKPWQRDDHVVQLEDETVSVSAAASDRLATTSHRVDVPDRDPIPLETGPLETGPLETGPLETGPASMNQVRRVIYRRQFHRPSGIEWGDRVLLEVGAALGSVVAIRLNTFTISGCGDRWNLNEQLADHNELEIELESALDAVGPPRLIGEVNLWIVPLE